MAPADDGDEVGEVCSLTNCEREAVGTVAAWVKESGNVTVHSLVTCVEHITVVVHHLQEDWPGMPLKIDIRKTIIIP